MVIKMRPIDLDELMKFPIRHDHFDRINGSVNWVFGVETVLEYAQNLPPVDAVEVVRCRECKCYNLPSPYGHPTYGTCAMLGMQHMPPEFYCAYGVKMDGDQ